MKLLITGGAGFIGANFVHHMLEAHPGYELVVVDALTYAGNLSSLASVADRITFVRADICDEALMDEAMSGCDAVVHFAAESHVDRSIADPGPFLRTNIVGTEVLLRLALRHDIGRFHHISTDEVFGALELDGGFFDEGTAYSPRSPYAASKAASDHLVRAYGETYGLPYSITNCSNNYGPYHLPEKAIPLFITNALDGKKIPLYGDGRCVRDYLFVTDHCRAIDLALHEGEAGSTYCVGGGAERNGIELAETILAALGLGDDMIEFVPDRPGHDRRYAIDASKIAADLGWKPSVSFDEGIERTICWYRMNEAWWRPIKDQTRTIDWSFERRVHPAARFEPDKSQPCAVTVVMPAYNAERFVKSQVDSILGQVEVDLRLLIVDDCSTDRTRELLERNYADDRRVQLFYNATNLGQNASIEFLLSAVTTPFFAIADHDDVWLPTKLKDSLAKLRGSDAELVYADLQLVDEDLRELHPSTLQYARLPLLEGREPLALLVRNPVHGCTVVARSSLLERALPFPDGMPLYDRWIALVAAAGQGITFLPSPVVLYRQHRANTIGAVRPGLAGLRRQARRVGGGQATRYLGKRLEQRSDFLEQLSDRAALDSPVVERLKRYYSWPRWRRLLASPSYFFSIRSEARAIGLPALLVDLLLTAMAPNMGCQDRPASTRLETGVPS